MAREHGQFEASAWREDDDWRALTVDAQWCYMMLLSQGDFTLAGVIHVSRKRWVKYAADLDIERLDAALATLTAERFVVIDEDTEELLVRSFARRKTQWKNPKRRGGFASAVKAVTSSIIRNALRVEVERVGRNLEGDEISGNSSPNPLDENSLNGLPEDFGQSIGRRIPSPVSSLSSVDPLVEFEENAHDEPQDDPSGALLVEHSRRYSPTLTPSQLNPWRVAIMRAVAEGTPPERIRAGLNRAYEKNLHAGLLPSLITETTPRVEAPGIWGRRV